MNGCIRAYGIVTNAHTRGSTSIHWIVVDKWSSTRFYWDVICSSNIKEQILTNVRKFYINIPAKPHVTYVNVDSKAIINTYITFLRSAKLFVW